MTFCPCLYECSHLDRGSPVDIGYGGNESVQLNVTEIGGVKMVFRCAQELMMVGKEVFGLTYNVCKGLGVQRLQINQHQVLARFSVHVSEEMDELLNES